MLLFYKLFGEEWKRRWLFAYFSWLNDVIVYKEEEETFVAKMKESIFGRILFFSFFFFIKFQRQP